MSRETIPCLTLTEPWSSLVATGAKTVETRGWSSDYRGRIGIHAAKGMRGDDLDAAERFMSEYDAIPAFRHYLGHRPKVKDAFVGTRGRVLATATLVACIPTDRVHVADETALTEAYYRTWLTITRQEAAMGNYKPGRWAWVLADVRPLPEPIPATGALGLWNWRVPEGVSV